MKKLILILLAVTGTFLVAQSQSLSYAIYNNSGTTWDYKMIDSGPSPAVYELGILPNDLRTGTINNFAFSLEWAAENAFGCYATNVETGPIYYFTGLPCFPAAAVQLAIVPSGFGNWGMRVVFH